MVPVATGEPQNSKASENSDAAIFWHCESATCVPSMHTELPFMSETCGVCFDLVCLFGFDLFGFGVWGLGDGVWGLGFGV